jgi:hypothetical protein
MLGIVPQGYAKLAHGGVNAAIRLDEYVLSPELFYDLIAADKFPLPLHKQDEQLQGNLFQFQCPRAPAQLKAARIQDVI